MTPYTEPPDKPFVVSAGVQQARQQDHHGHFREAEGDYAGAEGSGCVEDGVFLLLRREEAEVLSVAVLHRHCRQSS